MKITKLLISSTVVVLSIAAQQSAWAQYVWIDGKGVKQYSDLPPPTSVPRNKILKDPGSVPPPMQAAPQTTDAASKPAASADASAKTSAPMTIAERNADFQKRALEKAEKDKKAAAEAKLASDKASNCERARAYSRSLKEGSRITNVDKNGERGYLTDEQRAVEVQNAQRVLSDCK